MTAVVYDDEALVPSYPTSPKPRRQPMTPLKANQRSYSRVSSKGIIGDESPLLLSPMPKYPNRRRSVTFADETEATVREERPYYTVPEMGTTPNKRYSESPIRRPILKNRLGENNTGMSNTTLLTTTNATAMAPTSREQQISGDMVTVGGVSRTAMVSGSITPKRGRSNSHQRRAARRKQAEQQYGFYDDSMVEEYVLKARKELEMEEEEERLEEKLREQEKEKEEAENKAAQATLKINALQQAKEYLLSTTNTRHSSPVSSSIERDGCKSLSRSHQNTPKKELIPLQGKEKNKEDVENEGQFELMRNNVKKSINRSMPLVASVNETDNGCSRKRVRQSSSKKVEHSVPVVRIDYGNDNDMDNSRIDSEEDEEAAKRKKNKLERIIARVIEQQAKRRHGKRSVVVIDWDSEASDGIPAAVEENEDYEERDDDNVESEQESEEEHDKKYHKKGEKQELLVKAPSRQRKAPSVKKSTVETVKVVPQRQTKPPPATRSVTVRAPSTRKRNVSVSIAPDLGEDSLLIEEDQPVLLRRPTTKRRLPTRSISYVSVDAEDNAIFEQTVDVSRKPPQRAPAPKVTRRGRKPATTTAAASSAGFSPASIPASSPPLYATHSTSAAAAAATNRGFSSVHHDLYAGGEAATSLPPSTATVASHTMRSRRGAAAAQPPIPEVSPDDPMAVFFGADFPSPSKFEEMLQAAGGLPEVRRVGRGHQRQPALLLPDTISRRR
ncbi:putative dynein heavy chain [Trypanosoma theileri]|uniref:Putative dynein heavy chain n=1 Tax=Trypanosoma theileri TaxID=67003 RepID=A0A1X0P3W6_9TRYP|nr:putative dynein heavy chain [Trypanosoma theileri]ORC91624.1 putative dynein heavy chain [Trypanosoma theileri]